MKFFAILFTIVCHSIMLRAGNVDTISIYSASMHKQIKCVIISPAGYTSATKSYPVVYLLHGFAGNYSRWLKAAPQLKDKTDEMQCLFVCPDGGYGSWYIDYPSDPSVQYETFTSNELVMFIDSHYRTIANRKHRAITGLSMGGHGSLYLAIRHKDLYGAAGSTSGVVDISHFPKNLDDVKQDTSCCAIDWAKKAVINLVDSLKNRELKLIIDCGVYDILVLSNRKLHEKLLSKGIEHDYIERPGTHSAGYWRNSIDYQLLFFKKFFEDGDKPVVQKIK